MALFALAVTAAVFEGYQRDGSYPNYYGYKSNNYGQESYLDYKIWNQGI